MITDIEHIPDADSIFYRIHKQNIRNGDIIPGAFRPIGSGMSTEWSKYSTPEDCRQRANTPAENAVVVMDVVNVRNINPLDVIHCPTKSTIAHSEVSRLPSEEPNKTEYRLKLKRICRWAIKV